VGIIGRNGAGKSTLLKILSRITEPSTGRVTIKGRVASLLEVGTGFHPELTGRENIYLNGTILGMTRAEIKRKFDEIVAFAEVEKYLDTPVKRYSSGMYVRLAFAVAAHLEPEILVVDEVLAVGDAEFQKKCLGKMGAVAKAGRTVLFVSHNMTAISSLCEQAILLSKGRIAMQGEVQSVTSKYFQTSLASFTERMWTDANLAPGNEFVRILGITLKSVENEQINYITTETPFILQVVYENLQENSCLNLSIHLFNEIGIKVFNSFPEAGSLGYGLSFPKCKLRTDCLIPGNFLNDGRYSLELHVVED
jgi:lipopolysaccharide transport system ATP-binding protein